MIVEVTAADVHRTALLWRENGVRLLSGRPWFPLREWLKRVTIRFAE